MIYNPKAQAVSRTGFKVCHWCDYDSNPPMATSCEVCGRFLRAGKNGGNRRYFEWSSRERIWFLGVCGLLLVTGGSYWLWTSWNRPPSSPTTTQNLKQASDVRLYSTLRDVPNVPKGLFNYGGAHTFAALTAHGVNDAIAQAQPQFQLRYTEPLNANPGSGTGISMLISGNLSVAQSARPLEESEYSQANNRRVRLEQVPIAIDGVLFFTHQKLSLPGLSVDQLQDIYRGKLKNWKQVGGPDLPIVPFGVDPKTTSALKLLLGNQVEDVGSNVKMVRDYTTGIRQAKNTPGSIFYGSAPLVMSQKMLRPLSVAKSRSREYVFPLTKNGQLNSKVFRDGTYPLTRRLFVVFRRDGTLDEQAGVAYSNLLLSTEGQRIVEKAGFVALH